MASKSNELAPDEIALLHRASEFGELPSFEDLTAEALTLVTREHGVDFATALLYDRIRKAPEHSRFISQIEAALSEPLRRTPAVNIRVVVVPGALYVERPDMGGDGKLVRDVAEECGLHSSLVPLASRGAATENAARLATWLEQQPEEKLVLVSLSKGGPEVKLALARPDAPRLFRNVVAWVNVCGPLDGSAVADWVLAGRLRRALLRFQYCVLRRDFAFVAELRREPGAPLGRALTLPLAMRLISLVGFPLRQHLSAPFARFCHRIIARHGPNDGAVLLSDIRDWPGEIYPVWGTDHYFRPAARARALIRAVLWHLAGTAT